MTSIDDLMIEESADIELSVADVLENIKDMISHALETAKRFLAGGVLATMMTLSIGDVVSTYIPEEPIEPIAITMPVKETMGTVQIADYSVNHQKAMAMLEVLSSLKDGWDGESAKSPSSLVLRHASFLIDEMDDDVLGACSIFASNDAGVYIQGKLKNGRMTIFLNENGMSYVVKGRVGKITASTPVTKRTVSYLNEGLKQFV